MGYIGDSCQVMRPSIIKIEYDEEIRKLTVIQIWKCLNNNQEIKNN